MTRWKPGHARDAGAAGARRCAIVMHHSLIFTDIMISSDLFAPTLRIRFVPQRRGPTPLARRASVLL